MEEQEQKELTKEQRIKTLKLAKWEQARELKYVELTIEKVGELNDILRDETYAKFELKKFLNKLIIEKDFQQSQIKEIDNDIDYIKSEQKGIKSIIKGSEI